MVVGEGGGGVILVCEFGEGGVGEFIPAAGGFRRQEGGVSLE